MARNVPAKLAFDEAEYTSRQDRVRDALRGRDIDILYVTSPSNIVYLTGYEASWYPPRLPVALAIHRDEPAIVFFDWARHVDYVRLTTLFDELETFEYATAATDVAAAFDRRGWSSATIGLEWYSPTPVAAIVKDVAGALGALGADLVEGDWIVDDLRLLKSADELQRIRQAGVMLDTAFLALRTELRVGMSELEVAARMNTLLAEQGSEVPAQYPLVSSGPNAWADVHSFPSRRRLEHGDVVSVDACAVVDRYHANLSRTFSMGTPNAGCATLLEAATTGLDTLCSTARLDDGPQIAMAAAERAVRDRIPAENIWWIGGYNLGIAFPPSWVGHTYLANDGLRPVVLKPGYVSNFETVIYDRVAGFEAAVIDTVVMTEAGLRPLSALSRELFVVT